jgi:hypothetical protein
MELNLTRTDVRIAEHHARVAYADRFGAHFSSAAASEAPRRKTAVVRTAALAVPRMIEVALRGFGALAFNSRDELRSQEHELATHGITWQTDADDDRALADQLRAAQQSRLSVSATVQGQLHRPARSHSASTDTARELLGGRLGVTRRTPVTDGLNPFGD